MTFKMCNLTVLLMLLFSTFSLAGTDELPNENQSNSMVNKLKPEGVVEGVIKDPVTVDGLESAAVETLSVEALKKKVIELNRDLFILEEDLLFPANTQFAVFVSLDTGKFLQLDSIKLKVNGDIVAAHLYTERQIKSLKRGGMQRLYIGNLKTGEHEITAFVDGIGPDKKAYKQAVTATFTKSTDIKSLEIKIKDQSTNFEPSLEIVEWN